MLLLQSALPLSLFRLQLLYMSYCRPYFWELLTTSTPCRSNATPIMAKERMQNLPSPTFLASSSPFPSDIANIAVQPIFFCGSFRNSCFLYRISLKYNCALVRDDTFFFFLTSLPISSTTISISPHSSPAFYSNSFCIISTCVQFVFQTTVTAEFFFPFFAYIVQILYDHPNQQLSLSS